MALAKEYIERVTGYAFADEWPLAQALDTTGLRTPQVNRRLALLGDMLVRAIIVDEWFPTGAATGVADGRLQAIAGNTNLAQAGRGCGLESHITTHPGHWGTISNKTLATTVEALLGAVFLDSAKDLVTVKNVMKKMSIDA